MMSKLAHPLCSVIVPVYKAEEYISKCIDSILNQSYRNIELILVDDGSPDRSGAICDDYAAKDNRIRVFHTVNCGVSHARNIGLDNAVGEYLFFVDSDDWVSPGYVQNLLPKQGEDLIHSGCICLVGEEIVGKIDCEAHTAGPTQWQENLLESWAKGPVMGPVGNSYRRELIEKYHIRFDADLDIAEDVVFNLEYLRHCNQVRFIENCDYFYTIQKGSSLMDRHHDCRTVSMVKVAQAKERLSGKSEYYIRWMEWHTVIAHHRKWLKVSKGEQKKEIARCLQDAYRNDYFRESIPFIRKNGTLDEKVETFFMNRFTHPLYPVCYKILVFSRRLIQR